MRRLEKIPIKTVCSAIGISIETYGKYTTKKETAKPRHVADFMTFLKCESRNMGVNHVIKIRNMLKEQGQDENAFWSLQGKSLFQVRDQLAQRRMISFDQIVQAYGCLGFEVVVKDLNSDLEIRTYCEELETYKRLYARRGSKGVG